MSKIIRLIDRTRTVQDWKCPRSRYLGFELGGRGVTKTGTSLELFMGITVHDALAAIALGVDDIDQLARTSYQQMYDNIIQSAGDVVLPETTEFATEQGTLVEGLIRGYYKHVWPILMSQYKVIAVEQEMEYRLGENNNFEVIFMAKPDLIVEDQNGELVYLEYKTTASKKDTWINSWETAVQLHSSILATEQTLGRRPSYVQIVGLYKGYESYGKQSSPFCYAYKKSGNPPFTKDIVEYEFKPGLKRSPVWEMDGGCKAWVEGMPENVLANQFPLTAPIMVNEDLVKSFFKQRLSRELEIAAGGDIDELFPQHFDQCVPGYGRPCQFKRICHAQVDDPLKEGYEPRQPHHAKEMEGYATSR